jgi:toxin YoeB
MRSIVFTATALKDFVEWPRTDAKLHQRIAALIFETLRDPFQGLGKPEPLKHNLKGCWSRRISDEHRLVYTVSDQAIHVLSCKYHYD